jgi:hypothetical protein
MPKKALPIHIFKAGRRITSTGEVIDYGSANFAASASAHHQDSPHNPVQGVWCIKVG